MAQTSQLEAEQQESQATLVRILTLKLEQLRAEKDQLERVLEEPLSQALRQQLQQHLALQRHSVSHKSHRLVSSSTSPSTSSSSSSSFPPSPTFSSSTSPSFSTALLGNGASLPRASNPAIPSTFNPSINSNSGSPIAGPSNSSVAHEQVVVQQLRAENDELRSRLASSQAAHERAQLVNVKYERELRRLGYISMGDLEDLDELSVRSAAAAVGPSSRRERSTSRGTTWSTSSSTGSSIGGSTNYDGGIRIPGSSVSPPTTFPSRSGRAAPPSGAASYLAAPYSFSSRASYSSINTTLTTPSTSFPITLPPPTSPASSFGAGLGSTRGPPPPINFGFSRSPPSRQQSVSSWTAVASPTSPNDGGGYPYGHARIHMEDLLPLASASESARRKSETTADDSGGDDEGGRTPLSPSPGSRSGSLSRRASFVRGNAGAVGHASGPIRTNTTSNITTPGVK